MPDPGGWLIGLASFVRRTIRSLGGRTRADRDFEDEVRFHLEMEAASHRAGGVDAGEAERRAARAFGSVLRAREESHDARRVGPLENFGRDLALGLRALRRSPGVTFAAVISLGLGIAASTTMFSIANGILRDLPVREPDRLAHVAGVNRRTGAATLGLTDYQLGHLRQSARSFTAVGGFDNDEFNLGDETRWAERWHGAWVDPAVFEVLGAAPVSGRTFTDGDQQPGAPKVVLLGDRLWRQRYEAARGIVGRTVRIDGVPHEVIGIMAPGFRFPVREDLWLPRPRTGAGPAEGRTWAVIGRLRDGVTLAAASAEAGAIGSRLATATPAALRDFGLRARDYREQVMAPRKRVIFYAMVGVVSFLLVMACVNVANLLVARSAARSREMAIRAAVGASRSRIAVQVLTEVLVMGTLGGALGLGLATAAVSAFSRVMLGDLSYWMRVTVDWAVLGWAICLVLASTVLASLAPARLAARADLARVLGDSGRTATGFRLGRPARLLVGIEVALSATLLVVTALMIAGARQQALPDLRIDPGKVLVTRLERLADADSSPDGAARYRRALVDRIGALPGVTAVTLATTVPGFGAGTTGLSIEGDDRSGETPRVTETSIAPGYVGLFGARVVDGRDLTELDDAGADPVTLVDQRVAARWFGGASPLGRRIRLGTDSTWVTIVGVVTAISVSDFQGVELPAVYRPIAQTRPNGFIVAASTSGPAASVTAPVREAIAGIDRDVAQLEAGSLIGVLERRRAPELVFARLFGAFGSVALGMAALGLASLAAFAVRQRSREIAVRVALGAVRRDILALVMRGGAPQLIVGLVVGLGLAVLMVPLFGDAVPAAYRRDWRPYAAVAAVLGTVGLLALWIPARRALGLPPTDVFREE